MQLGQRCRVDSSYEIWSTRQFVYAPDGTEIYLAQAIPAAFDPITALNPADPLEVVYLWDPRVDQSIFASPGQDRTHYRGCDRESYAHPGYFWNRFGPETWWTDPFGVAVAPTHPSALEQTVSQAYSVGVPATDDGQGSFKRRSPHCAPGLGVRN
jgi:hypothetical protein